VAGTMSQVAPIQSMICKRPPGAASHVAGLRDAGQLTQSFSPPPAVQSGKEAKRRMLPCGRPEWVGRG